MITLRDYQQRGVDGIRALYARGKNAPLYVLPTGGGKTVVFSHVAKLAAEKGKRVAILVHRVELLRQTSAALTKNGIAHGLINPLFTPDYRKPVQVASVQTLCRRVASMPAPDLIIIDEAHHATAGTWRRIIEAYPGAKLLGVTATPCRGDGIGLGNEVGGIFDHLLQGPAIAELVAAGHLVAPKVYAPLQRINLQGLRTVAGDYDKIEAAARIDKPKITGSAVAHYARICAGAPAVVFCISVAHAEHVAAEFRAAGFRAYSVDGSMDDGTRARILSGLADGSVQVVTSCDLISEGTDIPAVACAILLRPTKSEGLYLQQVGRALRPAPGKPHAIILDHVGNVIEHGMPDAPREWTLHGEKRKRKKPEEQAGPRVRQCPQCFAIHAPAPKCEACGHVYEAKVKPLQQENGDLQQVDAATAAELAKRKRREVGQARTLDELRRVAAARGYKPGWAEYIFRSRQQKGGAA